MTIIIYKWFAIFVLVAKNLVFILQLKFDKLFGVIIEWMTLME
jgi:hypothetical protein